MKHVEERLKWLPYCISGDKHKLAQVIRNLVSNAIKFTPRGGRVVVNMHYVREDLSKGDASGTHMSRVILLGTGVGRRMTSLFKAVGAALVGKPSSRRVVGGGGAVHPVDMEANMPVEDKAAYVRDGHLAITVEDSGAGISEVSGRGVGGGRIGCCAMLQRLICSYAVTNRGRLLPYACPL